ncbi:MAG: hypothetical protein KF685_12775 [Acidobacteria bacterium]|nr:hypothetical protein [Acidobacteriota bacterium]
MMIKGLDARVATIWDGLRPITKKLLVGSMESSGIPHSNNQAQKFEYDVHADWELSRLLTALDQRKREKDAGAEEDAARLAEACARILETQSASAEVFVQLAARAIKQHDYARLDRLSDHLMDRFSAAEVAEIIRQTDFPQIRAIAYESLSMMSVQTLLPLINDPIYADIAISALEQKAYEYDSEEARDILDQLEGQFSHMPSQS